MCFLRAFLLLLLLLLGCPPLATATCPHWCSCTDDIIDCKGLGLSEDDLPTSLASSTRRLYLNNNQLTFIPSGFFDRLKNLHTIWGLPFTSLLAWTLSFLGKEGEQLRTLLG
uniref:LRRNT domain-containing protein n=1 Tax=Varanus komodoensis TaxID=61221 RepID=A0A8D2LQV9_VARKO